MAILADVAPYSREYNTYRLRVAKEAKGNTELQIEYEKILDRVRRTKESVMRMADRHFTRSLRPAQQQKPRAGAGGKAAGFSGSGIPLGRDAMIGWPGDTLPEPPVSLNLRQRRDDQAGSPGDSAPLLPAIRDPHRRWQSTRWSSSRRSLIGGCLSLRINTIPTNPCCSPFGENGTS